MLLYVGNGLTLGVEVGLIMMLEGVSNGNMPRHTSSSNLMYCVWSAAEHFAEIFEEMEDFLSAVHMLGKSVGLHLELARNSKTMVCWVGVKI